MRLVRWLPLCLLPLLAACIDDRIAYESAEGSQVITIVREQHYIWDDSLDLSLVVSRMPDCSRRHALGKGTAQTKVELWQYRPDTFVVKVGERMFATETRTCEGLEKLSAEPPGGMGTLLGSFVDKDGTLAFVAVPAKPAVQ